MAKKKITKPAKKRKKRIALPTLGPHFQNPLMHKYLDQHGGGAVNVPDSDFVLFADGAQIEMTHQGPGWLIVAPTKWEQAQLISNYLKIKADLAMQSFEAFQAHCLGDGHGVEGVNTDDEKLAYLQRLHTRARTIYKKYKAARKEAKRLTPIQFRISGRPNNYEPPSKKEFKRKVSSFNL